MERVGFANGALRFRGRSVERMSLEKGYEALLINTPLSFADGDVVEVDDERLLVIQASRSRIEYEGSASTGSRMVLLTRPLASMVVTR